MAPPQISELLSEIAFQLDDVADLSRFSQSDRFIREAITPLLFKDIRVSSRLLPALSNRLSDHPELAQYCRSLVINGPQLGTDRRIDQPDIGWYDVNSMPSPEVLSQSISSILRGISSRGRLEKFSWNSGNSRTYREWEGFFDNSVIYPIQAEFWTALSSTGNHLHELSLDIYESDREGFNLLARHGDLPNLQIFRLQAFGSYISPYLQVFLSRLHLLQHLDLRVSASPSTISPGSLTFESSHPHLQSLSLNLSPLGLPQDPDFIHRHPTIQVLRLYSGQSFYCNDASLPNLKALSVDETTVLDSPAFVSSTAAREIKHLRLNHMPLFHNSMVRNIVEGMASTLTCLDMDFGQIDDFRYWIRDMSALLRLVPNLLEFGMVGQSPTFQPLTATFGPEDLTNFLNVLDETSHLQAIRFLDIAKSGSILPEPFLEDLGKVPASLRYIKWDVHPDPKIYSIETHNHRTSAVAMTSLPVAKDRIVDWTSDNVLDHLSIPFACERYLPGACTRQILFTKYFHNIVG